MPREGRTCEPAIATGCQLCQRAHILTTSGQTGPCRACPPASPGRPSRTSSGAWLVARVAAADAFPDELDELAAQFFAPFRPGREA
jgi:hypothetical protein